MNGVNLDLLRAAVSRHGDPHAHHRAEHLANLRAARRQRWLDRIVRLRSLLAQRPAKAAHPCPNQLP